MKAKLTEADIPAILALRDEGLTQTAIARQYGVSQPVINRLLRGLTYQDVSGIAPQPTNRHLTREEVETLVRPALERGEPLVELAARLSDELGIHVTPSRIAAIRSGHNWGSER
jgi:DNA-binding transcriptional regulator LsrR (DeoR family)